MLLGSFHPVKREGYDGKFMIDELTLLSPAEYELAYHRDRFTQDEEDTPVATLVPDGGEQTRSTVIWMVL